MSTDWKLLTQVRDRHLAVAQEHVARERRAGEQLEARVQQAQQQLQAQLDAKRQLWQAATGGPAGGFSVAHLCQASDWSRSLDKRIAGALDKMHAAQQEAEQQQARLEASRHRLRAAAGELERAEQLLSRTSTEQRRRLEARLEDEVEEVAAQAWAMRRAG